MGHLPFKTIAYIRSICLKRPPLTIYIEADIESYNIRVYNLATNFQVPV